jgi:hypothetical protein
VERFKTAAALALIVALAAGCSGSGAGSLPTTTISPTTDTARPVVHPGDTLGGIGNFAGGLMGSVLNVLLTDAPPQIGGMTPTAINLGIDAVSVVSNGRVIPVATYPAPVVVNVLATQNAPAPIAMGLVAQTPYDRVQFTVDVATSNVVANGQTYPIQFQLDEPTQSSVGAGQGTKTFGDSQTVTMSLKGDFVYDGDPAASIQADFNAMESLAMNSQGQIVARPTLFAVPEQLAGDATGTVRNASGGAVTGATIVAVDASGNVDNTTSTDQNGNFDLHTIAAGPYQVYVFNGYTTAAGQNLNASGNGSQQPYIAGPMVTVQAGQRVSAGTITD